MSTNLNRRPPLKAGCALFALLFICYAYFSPSPRNWNVSSHIAISLAIVEDGTLSIDRYHKATGDKAFRDGRFYSNKAPGVGLSALPFAAATRALLHVLGVRELVVDSGARLSRSFGIVVYVSRIFTVGLMSALAAFALYYLAVTLGATAGAAMFAAIAYGLGSPAWGWSTILFAHALSGSCLFLAFALIHFLKTGSGVGRKDPLLAFIAGGLLSWAVVVEFTAAPASAILFAYFLTALRGWDRARALRIFSVLASGGLLFITPLLLYNTIAFGSPVSLGYSHVVGSLADGHERGFLGLRYPDVIILSKLLFTPYRGLVWFSPILLSVPVAIYVLRKSETVRNEAVVITLIAAYYLLMNSAYWFWDGGWSTGPRLLVPMLPFICLPLAVLWDSLGENARYGLKGLLLISVLVSFVCVSVDMVSPDTYRNPLFDYLIPSFLQGEERTVFGAFGLRGHWTLVPLALLIGLGYLVIKKFLEDHELSVPNQTALAAGDTTAR